MEKWMVAIIQGYRYFQDIRKRWLSAVEGVFWRRRERGFLWKK